VRRSERAILTAVLVFWGAYMLVEDVLVHYRMEAAHTALIWSGWALVIVWVGSVQIFNRMIERVLARVRLRRDY
jgi:hypothetical protein